MQNDQKGKIRTKMTWKKSQNTEKLQNNNSGNFSKNCKNRKRVRKKFRMSLKKKKNYRHKKIQNVRKKPGKLFVTMIIFSFIFAPIFFGFISFCSHFFV